MEVEGDSEIAHVEDFLRRLDPTGARIATVLRRTIDQLYDGQRTGRYCWDQLYKTEKTHCGTLVEINLQREFDFKDGKVMDFDIDGIEVDCKYSQRIGGWMIPPEAREQICMLASAEDGPTPVWSFGLVWTTASNLNCGANRDAKATLNSTGRSSIQWLWRNAPLPPNVLLQLPIEAVDRIMSLSSGARRINQLFREAQEKIVRRTVVATVAQQEDYMKRVRANGGARSALKKEGILVMGQYESHACIANALGIAVPGPGDFISVRVHPASSKVGAAKIGECLWRKATKDDPVVEAPDLPKV